MKHYIEVGGWMLGIILVVLKIILWSFLVAVAVILLLINLILWVPIRYRVYGSKYEGIIACGNVSYLLKIFRVKVRYDEDGVAYQVKVLWFDVVGEGKRDLYQQKPRQKKTKSPVPPKKKTEVVKVTAKKAEVLTVSSKKVEGSLPLNHEKIESIDVPIKIEEEATIGAQEEPIPVLNETAQKKDSNISEPLAKEPIEGITSKNPKELKKPKAQKVKKEKKKKEPKVKKEKKKREGPSVVDQVKDMWGFLQAEENAGLIKFVFAKVFKILKSILPRKIKGDVMFGLDDPGTTGTILGAICMFYPVYHRSLRVTPNFEVAMFEGDGEVSGKVVIGVVIYYGIRIVIDRRVRRLIKKVRNKTN